MGGLVLTRKFGEAVVIGGDVTVRVLRGEDRSDRVRLHIDAPRETLILREEIAREPGADPFRWLEWDEFRRGDVPLRNGEFDLRGMLVRRASEPGVLGEVMSCSTFPASADPELDVVWLSANPPHISRGGPRASQVEWKVSA